MAKGVRYEREALEFARALTFFDAVYAFALTLLVTTINDFSPGAWGSLPDLVHTNGPALLSFAISFAVVVQFWRISHRTLGSFRYLNNRLISLQLLVMFGVILIPFSTEAMGEPGIADLPLPVAVYALNVAVASLAQFAVLVVAERQNVRAQKMTPPQLRAALAGGLITPVVFVASIAVAYLAGPSSARYSWLALPILGFLAARVWGDADIE